MSDNGTVWAEWTKQGTTDPEAALREIMTDPAELAYVLTGEHDDACLTEYPTPTDTRNAR